MIFTDQLIADLIKCPKKVIEAPKDIRGRGSYTKRICTLQSADGQYEFGVFMNQNQFFQEDFSIGLVFHPKEEKGRFCLLRVNGPHGGTKDIPHHFVPHIHGVAAEDLNNGLKIERHLTISEDYSTFEDAVQFYVKRINIVVADRKKHFPPPLNIPEFDFESEEG